MVLIPIDVDESMNNRFSNVPECAPVLAVMPDYYGKVGYILPWIGYFASIDGKELVGSGGFKGQPKNGKIEIAYGTFQNHEGKGVGTQICRQLVLISLQTDPSVRITARTLQDGHASIRILVKNGFECNGVVNDKEDGEVFEWEFKNPGKE